MGCAAAPTPQDLGLLRHTACTGLLPLRARSRASLAPTACGQNQKLRGQASQTACGRNQKRATSQICFCRRRRSSSRLREQRWAAQRPQHLRTLVCSDTPRGPVYCRCAPDRGRASLLRPAARIKNAQHQGSASAEGVRALRVYEGSDGLRSGPNTSGPWFAQTHRVHRFTAAARQIAGKPRSYGLRPESKASRASLANGLRPESKARSTRDPLLPKA